MGGEGFKHIAVNAADDDDFVIRVGAPDVNQGAEPLEGAEDAAANQLEGADGDAAAETASVAGSASEAAADVAPVAGAAAAYEAVTDEAEPTGSAVDAAAEQAAVPEGSDFASEAAPAVAAAAADVRGKAKNVAGESQRRPQKDDGYHETTLEDLKGEKMSLTQRVVIIAAIICIIGAIVYYFAFMR